jgi:hypothetical protein
MHTAIRYTLRIVLQFINLREVTLKSSYRELVGTDSCQPLFPMSAIYPIVVTKCNRLKSLVHQSTKSKMQHIPNIVCQRPKDTYASTYVPKCS